ncbi:Zn-ribbon-containing protein [Gallibacterium anatis]|uniref:Zn-ribbon-containing protein n=1 Tax=Gallibacterium anatis TaxID=750 RepID=UPI0039FC3948
MFLTKINLVAKNHTAYHINESVMLCNQLIDAWRYNGQIIGREIPLTYYFSDENLLTFEIDANCPEQDSLHARHNSEFVTMALDKLAQAGIFPANEELQAIDLNSDETCTQLTDDDQLVLYTNYLKSSSPICTLQQLLPVPLYHFCYNNAQLGMNCIRWQEDWQACDQLQMNGNVLVNEATDQISDFNSLLSRQGYALRQQLENHIQRPVYYYLYRVGEKDKQQELARRCPCCGREWLLTEAINIFQFKCDHCRLVSNLSWNIQ